MAGLVKAEPDTGGRIVYIAVDDVAEPEKTDVPDVEADPQFLALYLKFWSDERNTLERCEPRDPAECYIPNPANFPFNFRDSPDGLEVLAPDGQWRKSHEEV